LAGAARIAGGNAGLPFFRLPRFLDGRPRPTETENRLGNSLVPEKSFFLTDFLTNSASRL
jgi:hypothetical protein